MRRTLALLTALAVASLWGGGGSTNAGGEVGGASGVGLFAFAPAAAAATQGQSAGGREEVGTTTAARLNPLMGTYRERESRDGEIGRKVLAATAHLDSDERERQAAGLVRALQAPPLFTIEQYGTTVTLNQPPRARAPYEADGKERTVRTRGGDTITTRAVADGTRLTIDFIWSGGERLRLVFEKSPGEPRLTFTRTAVNRNLPRPVSVVSVYEQVSPRATRNFKGL